jgi:hypothetical protein
VARLNADLHAAAGAPNPAMLNHALGEAARLATHDWLVVLISDANGADAATAQWVSRISAHNDVIAIFVSDPLEAALPPLGMVVLAQGADRLSVDTSSARLRQEHAEDFATRRDRIRSFGRHRAIPVLDVRTDGDAAAQIRMALHPGTATA